MRNIPQPALELISKGQPIIFGFHIRLEQNKHLYLTDYSNNIVVNHNTYYNYSALHIKKANFNDTGHDFLQLEGIFQTNGIQTSTNLTNAVFDVILIFPHTQNGYLLFSMSFVSIEKSKLNFTLHLKNQTTKLEHNITKVFSKTCRAKLGDLECGVDLAAFSQIIKINTIEQNGIITDDLNKPSGYYDYGKLEFLAGHTPFLILTHKGNMLRCHQNIPHELIQQKSATITPACDKTIQTCHGRFANAINFRGEPFIPTHPN